MDSKILKTFIPSPWCNILDVLYDNLDSVLLSK